MAELVLRSVRKMAHTDWLLRGPLPALWEGITPFLMTGKFWRENVLVNLNENKENYIYSLENVEK